MQTQDNWFGKCIIAYTREQAIADGYLVDISSEAMKSGFKIPVAVTRSVWDNYIEWIETDTDKQTSQDQTGRLADILYMFYLACRSNRDASEVHYSLYVIPRDGVSKSPVLINLKGLIGGGDTGEPVITIMLTDED